MGSAGRDNRGRDPAGSVAPETGLREAVPVGKKPKRLSLQALLARLAPHQREPAAAIAQRIEAGLPLARGDIGLLGLAWNHLQQKDAAEALGVTVRTLHVWTGDGAPRHPDGFYSLPELFTWRLAKEQGNRRAPPESAELMVEKLKAEIDRIKSQTERNYGNLISRDLHENVLVSRASSLRSFLEGTALSMAPRFVSLSLDAARERLRELFKDAMDAYVGGSLATPKQSPGKRQPGRPAHGTAA